MKNNSILAVFTLLLFALLASISLANKMQAGKRYAGDTGRSFHVVNGSVPACSANRNDDSNMEKQEEREISKPAYEQAAEAAGGSRFITLRFDHLIENRTPTLIRTGMYVAGTDATSAFFGKYKSTAIWAQINPAHAGYYQDAFCKYRT